MLDLEFIRKNTEAVERASKQKGVDVDVKKVLELDEKRRELIQKIEGLRAERNDLTGKKEKPDEKAIKRVRKIKEELGGIEEELKQIKAALNRSLAQIPNPPHESVPEGRDESDNETERVVGEIPEFGFTIKDHETLGKQNDLIDLETAAQTSGSRFYYLKNGAVQLEFALVQWLLEKYRKKGFTVVTTPQLVREHMMFATGFFPADRNEIYHVNPDDDDLYLIGTSEVTLAGLHMFEPLKEKKLPKRYVGFSTCFRREAGSYGQDTKGIFRVHQFDKLEMYSFTHPDKSWEEHEFLLEIEEEILRELELPYQVVNVCSEELGASAAKKYDCEVWVPAQKRYRELMSCSNTTDFQSRRGGIKYRDKDGELHFAHTLNGTAMASTRTILAIMENYQREDGMIEVPQVLQKYLGREVL